MTSVTINNDKSIQIIKKKNIYIYDNTKTSIYNELYSMYDIYYDIVKSKKII